MAKSRQAPAAEKPHDGEGEFDPVYEWLDDGGCYLLRLSLPGFKKEDFRVHVDAAGRLTVIGQGAPRLHKAFQLPNTANLDGITGRFDGAVLTLTVPKLRQPGAVAPLPKQSKAEQAAAGETRDLQEDDTAAPKVGRAEAETERRIEAERTTMSVRGKDEVVEDKRKAEAAPPLPVEKADGARPEDQVEKASADHRSYVAREAARRIEAARAKVAEAKAAAERTCGQWKERAAAEGIKWAETIGQKEVIATAVAAFTLGVFVSRALTRR